MAVTRVASKIKAPKYLTYNLPSLEKQQDDRIMDVWIKRRTNRRRKRQNERGKEKTKVMFAL